MGRTAADDTTVVSSDITKIASTAVSAKNAAASESPLLVGMEYEAVGALTTDGGTAGDKVPWKASATGVPYVTLVAPDGELAIAPQAYGIDAVGADAYTTVVTAGADRKHITISLQGSNDAIVSLDSGTTNHYYIPANSIHTFDDVRIDNSATVQGKNASAGNNYTNLAITIW